jgi:hypothetical protein
LPDLFEITDYSPLPFREGGLGGLGLTAGLGSGGRNQVSRCV